jgi:hypothetical protein
MRVLSHNCFTHTFVCMLVTTRVRRERYSSGINIHDVMSSHLVNPNTEAASDDEEEFNFHVDEGLANSDVVVMARLE